MFKSLSRRSLGSPRGGEKKPKDDEAEEEEEDNEYFLKVKVVEGRNLRIADAKTKSSDPFVEIKLKGEKYKTTVQEKTLKPKWNESFTFGDRSKHKKAKVLEGNEEILFHVLDKDYVFNDDLGAAIFSLSELKEGTDLKKWLPLKPLKDVTDKKAKNAKNAKKAKEQGEICVVFTLVDANGKTSAENKDPSDPKEISTEPEDSKGAPTASIASPTPSRRSSRKKNQTKLVVKVIQGKGLRAADRNGKSDPYCSLHFGRQKQHTKTKKKTLDPTWNEEFEFPLVSKKGVSVEADLRVDVYDDDLVGDDMLGTVTIPLEDLRDIGGSGKQAWYPLVDPEKKKTKKKKSQGELELVVTYNNEDAGQDEEKAQEEEKPRAPKKGFSLRSLSPKAFRRSNTPRTEEAPEIETPSNDDSLPSIPPPFTFELISAKGLRAADKTTSDPYCSIRLGKEKHKSKTKPKTLNPTWDESFRFEKSSKWKWEDSVQIHLFDSDFLSSDDLGVVEITLKKLYEADSDERWYEVQSHSSKTKNVELGSIKVKVVFDKADECPSQNNDIKLQILQAKGLRATDRGNSCDPYCVISYKQHSGKTKKHQTKVVNNTLEPEWKDAVFELTDIRAEKHSGGEPKITVKVMDKDILSSDLVGKTELSLQSVMSVSGPQWVNLEPSGKLCIQVDCDEDTKSALVFDDEAAGEKAIKHVQAQLAKRAGSKPALKEAFELHDTDKSGLLDRDELKQILAFFQLTKDLDDRDVNALLNALDTSRDGLIDFQELEAVFLVKDENDESEDTTSTTKPLSKRQLRNQPTLNSVIQKIVSPITKMGDGASESDLIEDFVSELKKNCELFDENGSGKITLGKRFDRVLVLSKSEAISSDHRDNEVLLAKFGSGGDDEINYLEFCEFILDFVPENPSDGGTMTSEAGFGSGNGVGIPLDQEIQKHVNLLVKVIRAENLLAADRNGKSDPFLVMKLVPGGETHKTKVIKKTLDPVWNEEVNFGKKKGIAYTSDAALKIQVKDKDMLFSDTLGAVTIPLDKVVHNNRVENWYTVEPAGKKTKVTGRVLLVVSLEVPNTRASKSTPSAPLSTVDEYTQDMDFSPGRKGSRRKSGADASLTQERVQWHDHQLREIREIVAKAIRAHRGNSSLRNELERLDVRHNGYITLRRLQTGLEAYGIQLSTAQLGAIVPRVDPEGVDRIDYALFCKIVRSDAMNSTHKTKTANVQTLRSRVNRVLSRAHTKKTKFSALFLAFDPSGSGLVSDQDCCSILRAMDGSFDSREIATLAQHIPGAEQNGYIKYQNFVKGVCPNLDIEEAFQSSAPAGSGILTVGQRVSINRSTQDVINKFKQIVRKLSMTGGDTYDFGRTFEQFDKNGDGKISRREFRSFVEEVINSNISLDPGDKMSEQEVQLIMGRFDSNGDGELDYVEFLELISLSKEELEGTLMELRKRLVLKHRQRKRNGSPSLLSEFSKHDKDGDGTVPRRHFRQILRTLDESSLNAEELRYIMDKFSSNGLGGIDYKAFAQFILGEPTSYGQSHHGSRTIEAFEVDQIMRGEDPKSVHYRVKPSGPQASMNGYIDGALLTVDGIEQEYERQYREEEADMWHPRTIAEWLDRFATPAERRDFDEIYRSVSQYKGNDDDHIATRRTISPNRGRSRSRSRSRSRPRGLATNYSRSPPPVRTGRFHSPDHSGFRSPSPMDRNCSNVGWRCGLCRFENRTVSNLNDCEKCGAIRSASAQVVVHCADADDISSVSSSDSSSYETTRGKRRASRSRSKQRGRTRGRSRSKRYSKFTDSSSDESSSEDERYVLTRRSRKKRSDYSLSSSSSVLDSDDTASLFQEDFWGSVKSKRTQKLERKKKRHSSRSRSKHRRHCSRSKHSKHKKGSRTKRSKSRKKKRPKDKKSKHRRKA